MENDIRSASKSINEGKYEDVHKIRMEKEMIFKALSKNLMEKINGQAAGRE